MNNNNLDTLSDAELRNKLIQNGFPNMPVTETTRKILIKKLKAHLNNEKKKRHRDLKEQRSLGYETDWKTNNTRMPPSENFPINKISESSLNLMSRSQSNRTSDQTTSLPGGLNFANTKTTLRPISSPKIYTPAPILASESEEDSDYLGFSVSGADMRRNISLKNSFGGGSSAELHNKHYGVVNRLLSLRDNTIRKSEMMHHKPPSPMFNKKNRTTNFSTPRTILDKIISRTLVSPGFKQAFIPYALVGTFALFFIVLVSIYIIKSPDLSNTIHENRTHFTVCNDKVDKLTTSDKTQSLGSCIESDRLASAIELIRELIRLLQEQAKQTYCVDKKLQPTTINAVEFIRHLYKKSSSAVDVRKTIQDLQAAEYLIERNPQWQIAIVNAQGAPATITGKDMKIPNDESNFILMKPNLPLKCILYNKLQRFFVIIGTAALIGVLALICYVSSRYIRDRRNDRITAVDNFTTDIVNELLYRASLSEVPDEREVIVNHLRDKLLPFSKRNSLLWSWNEALRVMEANDSRIQFGVTIRNGEEFRTLKWIGENIMLEPCSRSSCGRKQWHSPAFDNGNKIVNPPTPCLKIRHMFDSSEINHPNLKEIIEEAILEKVGAHCNIVDIQIDKQSCCVYVRCATESDAGVVHNEINGWWFDKRLVSIKFLRLQRYLCRFPKTSSAMSVSS